MSPSGLVLTGTEDELRSYRCLKVVCAAIITNTPLSVSSCSLESVSRLTPSGKSICLSLNSKTHISSIPTILRTLANLSPSYGLYGFGAHSRSPIDSAMVDSWMSFISTGIEIPMGAISLSPAHEVSVAVKRDVTLGLECLNSYLSDKTYLVGDGVTIADISAVCALREAKSLGVWEEGLVLENLGRWYETMVNQEWFLSASGITVSSGSSIGIAATPNPSTTPTLIPPPVQPALFKRSRIRIRDLFQNPSLINQTVTVKGWARTTRNANKGELLFVELNDGSCNTSLQCVLSSSTTTDFAEAKNCGGAGASFSFIGTVIPSPAQGQPIELSVTSSTLLGPVYGGDASGSTIGAALYPLSKKAHTLEHMRDIAHLRPRARLHAAAMRMRHAMAYATHKFFNEAGFLYVHTPIVTCADCEGAGEQFAVTTMLGNDVHATGLDLAKIEPVEEKKLSKKEMKRIEKLKAQGKYKEEEKEVRVVGAVDYTKDFFSRRANLTVSGQLNVETHACALSDVYTFGPTFRAENSHTARHLSEFWMIEPEIAFADLEVDINLAEDYLKYCVSYALEMCAEDLEFFENSPHGEAGLRDRLKNVLNEPFKRLTYTEAIEVLQSAVKDGVTFEEKPDWGIDLPSEHERYLCEKVYKRPVVLTDYPKDIKAFYMKLNEDGKTVAAADILVPKIGEIIGGSQREHRYDVLKQRCIESGLDPKAVWWYLDLRKYGTVPHAGFGLGFERLILFVTGLDNIRDVIPFPRWAGNAVF